MKFFIDTADLKQIKEVQSWCSIDGVTTNPSLVAKTLGVQHKEAHYELIKNISKEVKGPISAEVLSVLSHKMVEEAEELNQINSNIVIKLPLIKEGLKATRILYKKGIKTNLTLCFSALQALAAARAGATFVSVFVGRLDDIGVDGMDIVDQIIQIFSLNKILNTKVLVASVRSVSHIQIAAQLGADSITIPPALFLQMIKHPLTDKGLDQFLKAAGVK